MEASLPQTVPSAFTLKVVLHCTKTEEVEEKVITFESFPATILDIKKQIEKQHSVPMCVQEISYDGHKVNDSVELSTMKVRNGDTFHIKYLAKGHCSEITDTLTLLNVILTTIEDNTLATNSKIEPIEKIFGLLTTKRMFKSLASKYFVPWLDSNTHVNKLHFVHYNGIEVLVRVYKGLLHIQLQYQSVRLKATECALLYVLWNFSESFQFKRLVIGYKVIQMCTQSMLRIRLEEGRSIEEIAPDLEYTPLILLDTIKAAAGFLCVLSEVPECHMEIATNKDILHQMTCLSILSGVDSLPPQIVAITFVCLASTPGTHKYITERTLVRRLLDSCKIDRTDFKGDPVERSLLKYFTMVFLAQVALTTPHCIPQDYQQEITSEMRSFLETTHYQKIKIEQGCVHAWCTFLPYIKLAYIPSAPDVASPLQMSSLQLMIFCLQNILRRDNHCEILLKEGLLDYVMCMPQYVPASLRPQAKELVRMVASAPDNPEGPPKLLNLVKACLAKMYFGLEQVLSLSASQIASKVLLA